MHMSNSPTYQPRFIQYLLYEVDDLNRQFSSIKGYKPQGLLHYTKNDRKNYSESSSLYLLVVNTM